MRQASLALVVLASLATACVAEAPVTSERQSAASIPFASLGAVRDFRAIGDRVLLIEGSGRRWYRASFFGPCLGLRSAERIAFVTEPGGSLDRFSAIWVEGRRCAFRSFEPTEPPARSEREERERE